MKRTAPPVPCLDGSSLDRLGMKRLVMKAFRHSEKLLHAGRCFHLRAIAKVVALPDDRRPVDCEASIERRDGGSVRVFERE